MRPSDAGYRYARIDHHIEQVRHDLDILLAGSQIPAADFEKAMVYIRDLHRMCISAQTSWRREYDSSKEIDI